MIFCTYCVYIISAAAASVVVVVVVVVVVAVIVVVVFVVDIFRELLLFCRLLKIFFITVYDVLIIRGLEL